MAQTEVVSGAARINQMLRNHLQSTSLNAAAYQQEDALLEVEFRSGEVYHYFCVPAETYEALLVAQSQGAYFNHYIRNCFAYARIS